MSANADQSTIANAPVVKLTGLAKLPSLAFRTMTETMRVVSGIAAWTTWRVLGGSRTPRPEPPLRRRLRKRYRQRRIDTIPPHFGQLSRA